MDCRLAVFPLFLGALWIQGCRGVDNKQSIINEDRLFTEAPVLVPLSEGTDLGLPRLIDGRDSTVVVYDYAESVVLAFSLEGDLLWQAGRKGAGPEEFAAVMDLAIGDNGDVWVLDRGNDRIAVLDSSGLHRGLIAIGVEALQRIALPDGDTLVARSGTDPEFLASFGWDGKVEPFGPHPVTSLRDVLPYFKQVLMESGAGSLWAALAIFGGEVAVGRGRGVLCNRPLVTSQAISEEDVPGPDWAIVAAGLALVDEHVFVLARPSGDLDLKILDVHGVDCGYRHSIPLPSKAVAIAGVAGGVVIAVEDPEPQLMFIGLDGEGRPLAIPLRR